MTRARRELVIVIVAITREGNRYAPLHTYRIA